MKNHIKNMYIKNIKNFCDTKLDYVSLNDKIYQSKLKKFS